MEAEIICMKTSEGAFLYTDGLLSKSSPLYSSLTSAVTAHDTCFPLSSRPNVPPLSTKVVTGATLKRLTSPMPLRNPISIVHWAKTLLRRLQVMATAVQ